MKINEVESLVHITKKNIRFYEEQGLLSPRRNSENGYRDYSEDDILVLQQIKLFRKLGVPIEEIKHILNGTHTVGDGMRRHLISLEREQQNLSHSIAFCKELQNFDSSIKTLDTLQLLRQMEDMEKNGSIFQNKHTTDVRVHYVAPVVVTILMVGIMTALSVLMIWTYNAEIADAPPLSVLLLFVGVFVAIGIGVVLALIQRIREIGRREIDDAKRY